MMQVTEIFRSIQGESTYAGLPCIFVRLTGCNLRCTWCDTAYAFHGGTRMSIDDVLGRVFGLQETLLVGCAAHWTVKRKYRTAFNYGREQLEPINSCARTAYPGAYVLIFLSLYMARLTKSL